MCSLITMSPASILAADVEVMPIGLTTSGEVVEALRVRAGSPGARRIAIVGGLEDDLAGDALQAEARAYADLADAERSYELVMLPSANPERVPLRFPPTGAAYREHAESHLVWRWLGLGGPDLVLIVGADPAGLATALEANDVAGVASIPVRSVDDPADVIASLPGTVAPSPAALELEARRRRTPEALAGLLAPIYSQSFDTPLYIDGMGLIAHLGRGDLAHVESLVTPYVDGTRDSLAGRFGVSSLVLAGHLVFAELADRTGDPRYLERARAAADFGFDDTGEMLEAMPAHGEMSDSIFMGASILAAVGDLTGERRYHDMAARHIAFMNALVRRDDGLYRHSPLTDAAWGRGNGFAAIGYALTLSHLPEVHPSYSALMAEYLALMAQLKRWQNDDGTWSQVVDHPAAYHETSSTAIIGFSMQRGLNRGWLDAGDYAANVERAFGAVSVRTGPDGSFIDVSESTNKQPTLEDYLMREALSGRDQRTGSFAMLFAVERAGGFSSGE